MPSRSAAWTWLQTNVRYHTAELALSFRVTVSAVLTLVVSETLGLPLPLWGVLTAVILTQMSVGRSLKATIDYLIGTVGGAVYAGAVGALVPHEGLVGLIVVLAITVAPITFLSVLNPRFSAAPFTTVMIVLAPSLIHLGPIASALDRVVEVVVGGVIGLAVSLLVLPARAHSLVIDVAARMLELIARVLAALIAGLARGLDEDEIRHMQDEIGTASAQLQTIGVEAQQERITRLGTAIDLGPLLRTLLRLRHDLIMIGRAAAVPLPEGFPARLDASLADVATTASQYLHGSAAALVARRPPPPLVPFEAALEGYTATIAAMRGEGLTRGLSGDAVERLFSVGFALEQMHQHLADLDRFTGEFARAS